MPGARGPAVSACRAADSSPRWTKYRARSARLVSSDPAASPRGLFVLLLVVLVWFAWWGSWSQSPCWNCWIRCFQSFLGRERVPGFRWRSMRGNRSHSFRALTALASLLAAVMHSRANVRAWRTRPRMKCGGVWKKAHLFCCCA